MTMFGFAGMILLLGLMSVIVVVVVVVIASVTSGNNQKEVVNEKKPYYKDPSTNTHKSSSTSLVIAYVLLIVGFVVFGVTSISMSGSIKSLENQLEGMNYAYMQSNNQISDLYQKIYELEEVDDYVDRFSYELDEVTSEGEGVLEFTVYMRKLPALGEVSLVLENSDGEIVTIELMNDSMIFHTSLNVSLDERYQVSVVVEEGEELYREELTTVDTRRMLNQYRGIKMDEDWDQNGITLMFSVYNNYSLNDLLAFEEVWIEIHQGEVIVSTRLLTVPDLDINDYQEFRFDVLLNHDDEQPLFIKVTGVDFFGNEYEMFHEGW
ncbi:MAG: hypothetical protein ACVCEJ_03215 [Candidatus Izemoplasmataceae bacterium]